MNEELSPRLRLAITMPSNACRRFLSPSTTLTLTTTVSPGENSGTSFLRRLISSCSSVLMRSIALTPVFTLEFFQQLRFFRVQLLHGQQIGPPQPSPAQRLLEPPAPDILVVPRQQHLRYPPVGIDLRPRVLRAIEQPVGERLLHRGGLVAERPGELAHHRIDQRHRRQLAAREHEVADRDFLVDPALEQPLVHALVPPAQQSKAVLLRELQHPAVIQLLALRREVDHPSASRQLDPVQRALQRLGEHHHARPAAVRTVVHRPVPVRREIARIPRRHGIQPRLQRAARDPAPGNRAKHLREQRHHVEADHQSASHSTWICFFSKSTLRITSGTHGRSRTLPSPAISITSWAPLNVQRFTMPSASPRSFTTSRPTRS